MAYSRLQLIDDRFTEKASRIAVVLDIPEGDQNYFWAYMLPLCLAIQDVILLHDKMPSSDIRVQVEEMLKEYSKITLKPFAYVPLSWSKIKNSKSLENILLQFDKDMANQNKLWGLLIRVNRMPIESVNKLLNESNALVSIGLYNIEDDGKKFSLIVMPSSKYLSKAISASNPSGQRVLIAIAKNRAIKKLKDCYLHSDKNKDENGKEVNTTSTTYIGLLSAYLDTLVKSVIYDIPVFLDYNLDEILNTSKSPVLEPKDKPEDIVIIGAGVLGSYIAFNLAYLGYISNKNLRIHVIDYDTMEIENLNRMAFLVKHLGRPKVEGLRNVIRDLFPGVKIIPYKDKIEIKDPFVKNQYHELFKNAKLIVVAVDDDIVRKQVSNYVSIHFSKFYSKKPVIIVGTNPDRGYVHLQYGNKNKFRLDPDYEKSNHLDRERPACARSPDPSIATVNAIIAEMATKYIIYILNGTSPRKLPRKITFARDGLIYRFYAEK